MEPNKKYVGSGDGRTYFVGSDPQEVSEESGGKAVPIHGHSEEEYQSFYGTLERSGGEVVDLDQ